MLKWKCNLISQKYFVNMARNTVKNAILGLHLLLKSASKMREIPFQTRKIQTFSERTYPRTALEFSDFAQGLPRSGHMSVTRKFQLCRLHMKWQFYVTASVLAVQQYSVSILCLHRTLRLYVSCPYIHNIPYIIYMYIYIYIYMYVYQALYHLCLTFHNIYAGLRISNKCDVRHYKRIRYFFVYC